MRKITLLFAVLLSCMGAVQLKAEDVLATIGSNITATSQLKDGDYVILRNVGRNLYLYENATTGRIDGISTTPSVGSSYNFIFQVHANEDGTFSFSAASGRYIPRPARGGDVYTVVEGSKDNVTISQNGDSGYWLLASSESGTYWNGNPSNFTGWTTNSDGNSQYEIIPVTVTPRTNIITGLTAIPTDKAATITTGYYLLKEVNTSKTPGWIKTTSGDAGQWLAKTATDPTANDNTMGAYIWYVEAGTNSTITISSANRKGAWPAPSTGNKQLAFFPTTLTYSNTAVSLGNYTNTTPSEGAFFVGVKNADGNWSHFYHAKPTEMDSWSDANPGSIANIEFYPVDETALMKSTEWNYTVNYVYRMDGASGSRTQAVAVAANSIPSAPELNYATVVSTDKTDAITCDVAITVKVTESLPFEKTTDLASPKLYGMLMHGNTNSDGFVQFPGLDAALTANTGIDRDNYNTNARALLGDNNYWWAFTGNVIDGFEIYNYGAGFAEDGTSNPIKVGYGSNSPIVKVNPTSTKWLLRKSRQWDGATCFCKLDGTGNYIMNLQSGTVCYWNDNDNGSSIKFFTPNDILTANYDFTALRTYLNAPERAVKGSTYVEDNRTALTGIVNANAFDIATLVNSIETLDAFKTSVEAGELNPDLTAGKYYRFYNAETGLLARGKGLLFDPTKNGFTSKLMWGTVAENDINGIFKVEEDATDNTKFNIYCPNAEMYVQSTIGELADAGKAAFNLEVIAANQFKIKNGNETVHARGWNDRNEYSNLVSYNDGLNTASAWYVVPVTSFPLGMNAVGTDYYATAYLPFAATVEGADVYGIELNETKTSAHTIDATAIPAKEGVILKGTSATATLTITDNADAITDNVLTGTLKAVAPESTIYSLANGSAGIGFYRFDGTTMRANRAFLSESTGNPVNAFVLDFNGAMTGIGTIETIGDNAPVYDLSGRRVTTLSKSGIYIKGGKKYIAK